MERERHVLLLSRFLAIGKWSQAPSLDRTFHLLFACGMLSQVRWE